MSYVCMYVCIYIYIYIYIPPDQQQKRLNTANTKNFRISYQSTYSAPPHLRAPPHHQDAPPPPFSPSTVSAAHEHASIRYSRDNFLLTNTINTVFCAQKAYCNIQPPAKNTQKSALSPIIAVACDL